MQIITKEFFDWEWGRTLQITPFFDTHVGAEACDLKALKEKVEKVRANPQTLVIGGGDYADFITMKDAKRFAVSGLDDVLITKAALMDLPRAERDMVLSIFAPIADRFIALVGGNHEASILQHYERDIYGEIVCGIKEKGGFSPEHKLALGYEGWVVLKFYPGKRRESTRVVKIRIHHGFGGGRAEGSKATNLRDFLFQNDCDLGLMGHVHSKLVSDPVVVEGIDREGNHTQQVRKGTYCGTFLRTRIEGASTYAAVAGYRSGVVGTVDIHIDPFAANPMEKIRIMT